MHLVAKNLGPIQTASIDLDAPITVILGPNNSGKTALSTAIYGLARESTEPPEAALRFCQRRGSSPAPIAMTVEECRAILHDHAASTCGMIGYPSASLELHISDADFQKLQWPSLEARLHLDPDLDRVSISILKFSDGGMVLAETIQASGDATLGGLSDLLSDLTKLLSSPGAKVHNTERGDEVLANMLTNCLVGAIFGRDVVYLPAERAAVALFAHELGAFRFGIVDDLRRSPSKLHSSLQSDATNLTLPVADAIRRFLSHHQRDADESTAALGGIAGGSFLTSGRSWSFRTDGGELVAKEMTSSTVKSMAAIHRLLPADKGSDWNMVFIDEPELHLHPSNQRRFVRWMAAEYHRFRRRFVVSTHSDFVVREISNLVALGSLGVEREPLLGAFGYTEHELLDEKAVAVYALRDGLALRVPVSAHGFQSGAIEDEIDQLNRLAFAILEAREAAARNGE